MHLNMIQQSVVTGRLGERNGGRTTEIVKGGEGKVGSVEGSGIRTDLFNFFILGFKFDVLVRKDCDLNL